MSLVPPAVSQLPAIANLEIPTAWQSTHATEGTPRTLAPAALSLGSGMSQCSYSSTMVLAPPPESGATFTFCSNIRWA